MTGANSRLFAWFVVLATLLAGCTSVPAPPGRADGQPAATSEQPSAATATAMVHPTPAPAPTITSLPAPAPTPTPGPVPQPYALNLYQEGDFVPQYTFDWCVAASIQMAHNLIDDTGGGGSWSDAAQQEELWNMARTRSFDSYNGANPFGWAEVLAEAGMGPYRVVSIPEYQDALRTAAKAITETGRPVGLVMWRGRHAWVMSGFESFGDPALFPEAPVTGVRVLDPLYPHGSGQWGPSPAPNSLLTPDELAAQFVVREPRRWSSELPAGYLLVLPVAEA